MERYIGQVRGWSNQLGAHAYCGTIYDTSRPRGNTSGDMRRDYAFVEFTESCAREERALSKLRARLDWLNTVTEETR